MPKDEFLSITGLSPVIQGPASRAAGEPVVRARNARRMALDKRLAHWSPTVAGPTELFSRRNVVDDYVDQAVVTDKVGCFAERIAAAGHRVA